MRQLASRARSPENLGGIGCRQAFPAAVAEEASQAGETPGHCRPGVVAFMQVRHVGLQGGDAYLPQVGNAAAKVAEVLQQTVKILFVRLDRECRTVSLD